LIQQQRLDRLFENIPVTPISPQKIPEIWVTGIQFNSQAVSPGNVFVAQQGRNVDGHRFIPMAIERGASAVIGSRSMDYLKEAGIDCPLPYIQLEETRASLAYLSAAFYQFPAHSLRVIGVTGTDGKTTTSSLIYQILRACNIRTGIISTIGAEIEGEEIDTGFHVTTPEAPYVQQYLRRMVDAGLTHVVLEATSFGLAQHRVTACEFDVGVLTNITHEHLDIHGSYESYREAKAMLFGHLADTAVKPIGNPRLAVLNRDDCSYSYLKEKVRVRQISYSLNPREADVWAERIQTQREGLSFHAISKDFEFPVKTTLTGLFNVSNCLAAIAACYYGLQIPIADIQVGISRLDLVPGRMENISLGQDFTAIVDFAHTPNALDSALRTVRKMTNGRVIAVFGSAGLRDREKRKLMAEVSVRLADCTILTAEDPRTESLDDILAQMAEAARLAGGKEGKTFWRVPDRGNAIRWAIDMARPGDVVIVCGKGHEQSMCFGDVEYPWDDRVAVKAALTEYLGIDGPAMPTLPTSR